MEFSILALMYWKNSMTLILRKPRLDWTQKIISILYSSNILLAILVPASGMIS